MPGRSNHSEMELAARIKQLRLAKGLTQKAFAESLGIVQGYLSGIEQGKKIPSRTLLTAMQHVHGVTRDWLFDGTTGKVASKSNQGATTGGGIPTITLLRSIPEQFPDQIAPGDILDHLQLPGIDEDCFAISAEGSFMAPTIMDGDLLIFRAGNTIINRSIVLMTNRWGEVIVRRYRVKGEDAFFSSENPTYAPFKADASTRIFGTVIGIWRKIL